MESVRQHPVLLTTAEVCDLAASLTGHRPSPSAIFRWATRGVRGRTLPHRRLGSRLLFPRLSTLAFLGGAEPGVPASENAPPSAAAVANLLGTAWGGHQPKSRRR